MPFTGSELPKGKLTYISRIMIFIGLLFLCISLWQCIATLAFVNTAVSVEGRIDASVMSITGRKVSKRKDYRSVFVYHDDLGKQHRIETSSGFSSPELKVGELVPVLFRPDAPSEAKINTFWNLWSMTINSAIVGSVFLSFGIFVRRSGYR
jgi:hypothetical protein